MQALLGEKLLERTAYQCYCENTERVALQRRLPEDDQFVVPHNLYLTMFSPASVNVMPFDPQRGADHARSYAAKYAAKPEIVDGKTYFLIAARFWGCPVS